jgi:uncharacterized membrane protein YGL010W
LLVSLKNYYEAQQVGQNGRAALWRFCSFVFIISWIAQFWGHKIEGKKPSFLQDLAFLLIGPLWVTRFLYKKMGINV